MAMPDKILRITFSGVCTLTPPPPKNAKPQEKEKAFVLMPAIREPRKNEFDARIEQHCPFVYVPLSAVSGWVPPPADSVNDDKFGECNIYFVHDARIAFHPAPRPGVRYFVDPKGLPLSNRPGSNDVATEHDIRWLVNIGDVAAKAELKPGANPAGTSCASIVEAVVELTGGMLKANFPCKTAQVKTFADPKGPVSSFKRVLASEFFIEMRYPAKTRSVRLELRPLRSNKKIKPSGIEGEVLVLRWGDRAAIDLRIGNDTVHETRALQSFKRCDSRTRDHFGKPVAVPRDDDFDLHYDIIKLSGKRRPLPQNGPHQTQFDGCSPGSVRGGGTG